jgi:hypothetical protein
MFLLSRLISFISLVFLAAQSGCILFTQDPYADSNCVGEGGIDFGDAPDGTPTGYTVPQAQQGAFPSLLANGGATATVGCNFWIGERVTAEADYVDPLDPDPQNPNARPPGSNIPNATSDYDDGVGYEWHIAPQSTIDRLPAELEFAVQVNSLGGQQAFFNVLVDANRDGDWEESTISGAGEWAVRNHPVSLREGFVTYKLPRIRFPIDASGMPDCMWARITLSTGLAGIQSELAWSGTDLLGEGEVEDILVIGANSATCTVLQPDN